MPSKKRKYNARFPAGRIKKIMQTDEEVGKVAQAVPIIISRTLELFVESLLTKAMQVTNSWNAKTLSPSHVKQCILAESRFDFLRDLVKNIPDVSASEEKTEGMSAENSPTSSRFVDMNIQTRRSVKDDSSSSSSTDVRTIPPLEPLKRPYSKDNESLSKMRRTETITSSAVSTDLVIDLSKKKEEKTPRTPNFYQETLDITEPEVKHGGVIRVNPIYGSIPQPSTSHYSSIPPLQRIEHVPKTPVDVYKPSMFHLDLRQNNNTSVTSPKTPVTPILNIDFTKNLSNPEIKVLDSTVANAVGVAKSGHSYSNRLPVYRKNSIPPKMTQEAKQYDNVGLLQPPQTVNIERFNSDNLQIDEDYDT